MDEEEQPRGMTPARWAAVACLVAFVGAPVLSVLLTLSGSGGGAVRQLLVGFLAAVSLIGLIVVVVRFVVRGRDGTPDVLDDWGL